MADYASLKKVSLFSILGDKHLKSIFKVCSERKFAPDETIVEQGNPGVGLFIVLEGSVQITKQLKDGSIVQIALGGPGDVIGEMSVLDGATRTASVTALKPTTCLVLAAWSFKSLIEERPEVAVGILPVIVKRFRDTNDALIELRGSKAQVAPVDL